MLINAALAFLEGFALILSPCILPILPIMLSGSIEGGKQRPFGIILGFVSSFALFTLFARSLVQGLGLNLDWIRFIAFGFIILFGIILVSDTLSAVFNHFTQRLANWGEALSQKAVSSQPESMQAKHNTGLLGGLFLGILISLIWVPCGGPILAAAIVQTAVQKSNWQSFVTFLSFALGSAIPMVLIAWLGRNLIAKVGFLKTHAELFRKIFGLIIIVGAIIAAWLSFTPTPTTSATPVPVNPTPTLGNQLIKGLMQTYPAPAFQANGTWINSPPLNIEQLKGKVVLIDFWTYSCINCIRTLPYLIHWYQQYHPYGFEIIGVHTPEFEFEKNLANVKQAVEKDQITYPVVLDNDYVTWLNYHNQYWPAHYLINKEGQVVFEHFGEGGYAETEQNIRILLGLSSQLGSKKPQPAQKILLSYTQTPETYLGFTRSRTFESPEMLEHSQIQTYSLPKELSLHHWALRGAWQIETDKIIAKQSNASIVLHFSAAKVFAVLGSAHNQPVTVQVVIKNEKGEKVQEHSAIGNDVSESKVKVREHRLYELLNLSEPSTGFLELIPEHPGLEIYTFTFGSGPEGLRND